MRKRNVISKLGLDHNSSIVGSIIGSAAIGAIGSYLGGREARKGAEAAASATAGATREATALSRRMYEESVERFKPYAEAGEFGLKRYMEGLKDPSAYQKTPGYMFRLREGLKSIGIPDGTPRGLSGRQVQAAIKYGQDYATSEYDRYLARYGSLIDVGRGVATSTSGAAQQYAAGAGGDIMRGGIAQGQFAQQAGAARASAYLGLGNVGSQALQSYSLYQMMQPSPYSPSYPSVYGDAYMPGALKQ